MQNDRKCVCFPLFYTLGPSEHSLSNPRLRGAGFFEMQPQRGEQRGSRGGAPGSGEQRVNAEGSPGLVCSGVPRLGWGSPRRLFQPPARYTRIYFLRASRSPTPPPARSCERPRVCGRVRRAVGVCGGRSSEPQARAQEAIRARVWSGLSGRSGGGRWPDSAASAGAPGWPEPGGRLAGAGVSREGPGSGRERGGAGVGGSSVSWSRCRTAP